MNYKIGTVFLMLLVALAATEEDIEAVPVVPVVIQNHDADGPGIILTIDKSVTLPSSEESSEGGEASQEIQLESTETNRTTRSIGNIARLLLGGNVPPDHPLVKYPEPLQGSASTMLTSGSSNVIAAVPGMNNAQPNVQQNIPLQQQATSGTFQVPSFLPPNTVNNYQNTAPQAYPQNQVVHPQSVHYLQQQQNQNPFAQPQFNNQQQQYQAPPPVQQFQTSAPGFNSGGNSFNSRDNSFAPQANSAQAGGNPFYATGGPQPGQHGNLPPSGHGNGGNAYQANGAPYSSGGGVQHNPYPAPTAFTPSYSQQQQPYEGSGPPYQTAQVPFQGPAPQNWQNAVGGGGQDQSYYNINNYLNSQPSPAPAPSFNSQYTHTQGNYQPQPQPSSNYQQQPVNFNNSPPQQYNYQQQNNAYNVPQASSYNLQLQPSYHVQNQAPPSYNYNAHAPQGSPSTNSYSNARAPAPSYPNTNYNPVLAPASAQHHQNSYNIAPQSNNYNAPPPSSYSYSRNGNSPSSVAYQPSNTYSNYPSSPAPATATNSFPHTRNQHQPAQSYQQTTQSYNNPSNSFNNQGQTSNYNAPNTNSNYKAPTSGYPVPQNSYNAPKKATNLSGKNYPRSKNSSQNLFKSTIPPKYNSPKDAQGRPKGEFDHLRYSGAKKENQRPVSLSYNANIDITYDSRNSGVNYAPVTSPSTYKSSLLGNTGNAGGGRSSKSMNLQRPPVSFKVPPSATVTYNRYPKQTAPSPAGSGVKIYSNKPNNKNVRSQPRSYSTSSESNPLKRLNKLLNNAAHSSKVIDSSFSSPGTSATGQGQFGLNTNESLPNFRELRVRRRSSNDLWLPNNPDPDSDLIPHGLSIRDPTIVPSIAVFYTSYA